MKKIRQISQHPICILTVTISLMFASCSKNNVAEDQIESALNNYSGKELFRGIMLNDGEMTALIPELAEKKEILDKLDLETRASLENLENDILNIIEQKESSAFESFKHAITSGDHYQVREAILSAAPKVHEAAFLASGIDYNDRISLLEAAKKASLNEENIFDANGEINIKQLKKMEAMYKDAGTIEAKEQLLAVVAVAVAVAVYLWVWVVSRQAVASTDIASEKDSFQTERLVNSIVNVQ